MSTEWYCRIDGAESGPQTAEQLRKLATSGRLTREDFVRKGPSGDWVPAARVKGLFAGDGEGTGRTGESAPIAHRGAGATITPRQSPSPPATYPAAAPPIPAPPTAPAASAPTPAIYPTQPGELAASDGLADGSRKACFYCGEEVLAVAKKCRHCGEWLDREERVRRMSRAIQVVRVWNIPFYILLTFHIYWVFWIYRVYKELNARQYTEITGWGAVGRLFIPFYNVYWIYALFAELRRAIVRAYAAHHLPEPPTGWVWVMPVLWIPGILLNVATGFGGVPFTMGGASVTLCFVQSWMNRLAIEEKA